MNGVFTAHNGRNEGKLTLLLPLTVFIVPIRENTDLQLLALWQCLSVHAERCMVATGLLQVDSLHQHEAFFRLVELVDGVQDGAPAVAPNQDEAVPVRQGGGASNRNWETTDWG